MAISYIEKGYGLHEAIRSAGHWLAQYGTTWVSDDDVAVQAIIDSYSLDSLKSYMSSVVIAKATEYFNNAIANYSAGELAGWAILRAEATAYQSDPTASVPNIQAEAQFRGCDVATLVQKVLANASYFDNLRAQIAGISGKHRDAINALSTFDTVLQYDYSTGWPEV